MFTIYRPAVYRKLNPNIVREGRLGAAIEMINGRMHSATVSGSYRYTWIWYKSRHLFDWEQFSEVCTYIGQQAEVRGKEVGSLQFGDNDPGLATA